jgi:RNA polymerase sigma-70 factor, ECF subfamily
MLMATTNEEDVKQIALNPEGAPSSGCERADELALDDFEHIYAMYKARVYYLCLRMTGNPDDAQDLSQEAFLRLIQKYYTFRGESAFYTWLRRLAINVVLLRFQKASWRHETSLEAITELDGTLGAPYCHEFGALDPELLGAIDRISLERAIDQLSPGFKSVFILHDIEGYEHTEISNLLGCSIGTSKSQLHKARLKMREFLGETRRETAREERQAVSRKQTLRPSDELPALSFARPLSHDYETPISKTA